MEIKAGGDDRIRTGDLRVANAALSQLSYVPLGWRRWDSNPLPSAYETDALDPMSYAASGAKSLPERRVLVKLLGTDFPRAMVSGYGRGELMGLPCLTVEGLWTHDE